MSININDPRITQYALEEMAIDEIDAFENEIKGNKEILQEIENIREFSNMMKDGLKNEPNLSLSESRKNLIEQSAIEGKNSAPQNRIFIKFILSTAAMIVVALIIFNGDINKKSKKGGLQSPEKLEKLVTKSNISDSKSPYKKDVTSNVKELNHNQIELKQVPGPVVEEIEIPDMSEREDVEMQDCLVSVDECKIVESEPTTISIAKNIKLKSQPASVFGKKINSIRGKRKTEKRLMASECYAGNDSTGLSCMPQISPKRPQEADKEFNTENYSSIVENAFKKVKDNPLSTFSIDVDTASYANVRRFINQGSLPPPDAVRIEELINYFNYEYPQPDGDKPFSVNFDIASCPWNESHKLVKIGLKGKTYQLPRCKQKSYESDKKYNLDTEARIVKPTGVGKKENRPATNLVFLLDVSGSMSNQNKLPLLKKSMKLLLNQLGEKDRVAIVVYAGASGMVLPSTSANNREKILSSLNRLSAGGSTNGGAGIQLAYKTAIANFIEGGINRVILATDGDFNVGISSEGDLERLIEKSAKSGVFLTVLGFGMGNYKDSTLEKLSGKGNGNYAYIDTLNEAKKVLVNEMGGTLITIAKDVKIQVEFNPALVAGYRLIGYENRILNKEDFNDDKKDAGEIGAGHTVTAIYEIVPVGVKLPTPKVDALKYQKTKISDATKSNFSNEIMTVKLRYKEPDGKVSKLITFPLKDSDKKFASTSDDFKFAAAVAEFGMLLRNSQYKGTATYDQALELAQSGIRNDKFGYKKEFILLLKKAKKLHDISK